VQHTLGVYRCPDHPDSIVLCLEDEHGHGQRLSGATCCIRQYDDAEVARFSVDREMADAIMDVVED